MCPETVPYGCNTFYRRPKVRSIESEVESDPLSLAAKQLESLQTNTREDYMCLENKVALISGGGSIVNISSVTGLLGSRQTTAYTAPKAAVRLFTKSTAIHNTHQMASGPIRSTLEPS